MEDYNPQEQQDFFESLTQTHFLKVQDFFNTMPYIHYSLDYNCEHCDHTEKMEVRGIQNFFT
jgi:hypothetical protein